MQGMEPEFGHEHTGNPAAEEDAERKLLGLLLCRDLIFLSKIKGTAEALGYRMIVKGDFVAAKAEIESAQPRVVIVDLSAGAVAAPAALSEYLRIAGPDTQFVGFGSHVDTELLAAAKAAGCQTVIPRSKFSAELPMLLTTYFRARGNY
jgi:DNA-binding NarL/FixJ family response regulator